jgi:hypothetical protein
LVGRYPEGSPAGEGRIGIPKTGLDQVEKPGGYMTEKEKEQARIASIKEMQEIASQPDDKMYTVPVVVTVQMHKGRYMVYRQVLASIAMNEPTPKAAADKEAEFLEAMVLAGIDDLAKSLVKNMLGSLLGGLGGKE